jgi:hypothetical protein
MIAFSELERIGKEEVMVCFKHSSGGIEEHHENSIFSVVAKIQTRHLTNSSQKHYYLARLPRSYIGNTFSSTRGYRLIAR